MSSAVAFDGEVTLELRSGVALLTMVATEGAYPWGTRREEHRWNPRLISALSKALDQVESAGDQVSVLVLANEGKFWSNGVDLKFVEAHGEASAPIQQLTELMLRILCFPLPTVAALRGHWCAAGGMMGLAFDCRVMARDRGVFFIPGVDLGLVYSPMQMALMKAKLPQSMHRDVIVFNARRWKADELLTYGVVDAAVEGAGVLAEAMEQASALKPKGQGAARKALGGIKRLLYSDVLQAAAAGDGMDLSGLPVGVDRPSAATLSKM